MLFHIKGDDFVTNIILHHFSIFKYMHPNVMTFFGIILNIFIFYAVEYKNLYAIFILLFFRYLADCLDGGIARKYDKKSQLGGALDTLSDNLLIFIYIIIIFKLLNAPYGILVSTLFVILNLYIMSRSDSLIDHSAMKIGRSVVGNIYAFFINNTYILFMIMSVIIYSVW